MEGRTLLLGLLTVAFVLAGCTQSEDGSPDAPADGDGTGANGDSVTISGFAFQPQVLEVVPGTTVIWTNEDEVDHTATADDGSWDAGTLGPGGSDGHTFSDEGEHPYHCAIHPSMTGTITVLR